MRKTPDFQNTGKVMLEQIKRRQKYSIALEVIQKKPALLRGLTLIRHFEWEIGKKVKFQPALSLSTDLMVYFMFGFFLEMLLKLSWHTLRKNKIRNR